MSSFTYWPYDEVTLDAKHPGELTVKTPWLEATTSSAPFNPSNIARLKTKLHDRSLCADDLVLVNDFFRHFHDYPLTYILPTPKKAIGLDRHDIHDFSNLTTELDEVLFSVLIDNASFTRDEAERLLATLPRRVFEWDHEAALDFATLDGQVHPESIFSITRRYHLLELLTNDRGKNIFNNIRKRGAKAFRNGVARLLRQNHYVTEQCQESLRPAMMIAGQATPFVEDFMAAERGHDTIFKKALMHLGHNPDDIEVSLQTKALMTVLQYLAERNFLAFAMAVDAFERNNYEETDPIAKLLVDGGFEKSADFVNLHMKINDEGNHENVAQLFLQYMDLCDRSYALEAMRLMEVLSVVMSSVSQSAES